MSVSAAIKEKRKAAHITQVELAQLVNVSGQTVRRWEIGEREPSASDLGNPKRGA